MPLLKRTTLLVAVALLLQTMSANAQEPKLTKLLMNSPSPANSVLYMHMPSLKKLMTAANMESDLNERITELWAVAELDEVGLRPNWEAGYANLEREFSIDELMKAVDGYIDTVAGKSVVWSPRQTYLSPTATGAMFLRPTDRPLLAKFIKAGERTDIAPYLREQAAQPEQYLSLLFALNLEDNFSAVTLLERMQGMESLKNIDLEKAAQAVSSIRGVSIIVSRENLECILSFDFNDSPEVISSVSNALLMEILNNNQTSAPEIAGWSSSIKGNKLQMRGKITEASLDSLLSIYSLRSESEELTAALNRPGEGEGIEGAYESKQYFDRVNALIERVRKYEAQTTGYRAKWNDTTARRVDEIGTLGVDPQMVDYGTNVSSLLRGNAINIRNTNIGAGQIKAEQSLSGGAYVNRGGYYGGYGRGYGGGYVSGYWDPNRSTDYQRVTDQKARGAANRDYRQTLSQIDQLTADVRKAMTDKFKIQF